MKTISTIKIAILVIAAASVLMACEIIIIERQLMGGMPGRTAKELSSRGSIASDVTWNPCYIALLTCP